MVDLKSGESNDAPSEDAEDDNESTSSGKEAEMPVIEAAAAEVARVYAACARRLLRRINDMSPWFKHLVTSASRSRKKNVYATGTPSKELLDLIQKLSDVGALSLPQEINDREAWFTERCAKNEYITYATFTGAADPFVAHRKVFEDVAEEAAKCNVKSATLDGLAEELDGVDAQLLNLETKMEVRAAVAYRALVSDHLPQIIELDLEPGS
jgi:hypothetical protein